MRLALLLAPLMLLPSCHSEPRDPPPHDAAVAQDGAKPLATIRSASIELPADEETFAEGPHGDVLNRTCLACHSATMVRYQPPLTRKQWTATVDKMREAYGAPFQKAETETIVDALVATQPSKP